ncbi:MAG: hypothetical protein KDI09_17595, partial [Halioglobus sp.]|nr:hypothetical protein [Halioglobus sp.]
RIVQGTLEGDNLKALIHGIYPPDLPRIDAPQEFAPFDPWSDAGLRATAAAHTWLEVDQGDGSWLPLDPSFPRARIGEAYAKVATRVDTLPDTFCQQLRISLHEQTVAGKSRDLGRIDGCTAELGLQPISLSIVGIPQLKAAPDKEQKKGAADMFGGALSGDTGEKPKPEANEPMPPERVGVLYQRSLQRGAEIIPMASSLVATARPETAIRREWLRVEIQVPGKSPRVVERDLFAADAPEAATSGPAFYRRYSLVVMPGPLEPAAVKSYLAEARKGVDLKAAQTRLQASINTPESLQEIAALNNQIGSLTGYWLGLSLGAELSSLTGRIAFNNAVTFAQALPRIVIVSLEGEPGEKTAFRTAIDLRLDEVEAWPYPGHAARAAVHFQTARGMQDSMLEARYIERVLGLSEASNTMNLMSRLDGGPSGLLVFGPGDEKQLGQIQGLSAYATQLIEQSLKAGREVIVPPVAVPLAGRARFGWWEREPVSGRVVGVMDDGLNQAMADYSVSSEKIGMNSDTGLVLGAIVGATGTEILIAAKVLEHGEITLELIADIEKKIKTLKCLSCPEAGAKVSASASISSSCWKLEQKLEAGVGVKPLSFCGKYVEGLSCASDVILRGYKKAALTAKVEVKPLEWGVKMPCEE